MKKRRSHSTAPIINPVARAVAKAKLKSALVDQRIALYMMDQGAECADLTQGLAATLCLVGYAAQIDPKIGGEDSRVRIVRGGISALNRLTTTNSFDKKQTVAIDHALSAAEELNNLITVENVNKAWMTIVVHGSQRQQGV